MTSTADRVNYLNIGLMAASCLIAYAVPFELFLFSYAVLGPLHYLTQIYDSPAGLTVMRLIAFAYTYHYLNWFSKTSIIKWHEIPKARSIAILGLWIVSLAIYAWNYQLGFVVLYFLSVLHVMLEFPLNHQSFAGIGRELHALLRPAPRPARARG